MTLLSRLSQKGRFLRILHTYKSVCQTSDKWTRLTHARAHCVRISAVPNEVQVDDRFAVHVQGLNQGDDITIQANICDGGDVLFTSTGCFRANEHGCVDISEQESLAGNYKGVDAMGLMWSMEQAPGNRPGLRPGKKDVSTPEIISLNVFSGHHTTEDIAQKAPQLLATTILERLYKARDVKMIDVAQGSLRGRLFIPPGPGPFPGVIDMYGTAGGLIDTRAALLASRGFVTLALAFFGYQDLPKSFWELDLTYFKEAVNFLSTHPSVIPNGIGILGLSKGGELAQLIAIHCPQVRALISINGVPCLSISAMKNGCETMEPDAPLDSSKFVFTDENYVIFKNCVVPKENAHFFPVWQRDVAFLNMCGSDDQLTDYRLQQRQYEDFPEDHKHKMELVVYKGTGHMIEPPYTPVTSLSYHKVFRMTFVIGGVREQHARAQEDAWKRIQTFFRTHLKP
ncbi:acyl-coenzyme A thioesterase 5-like [Ylistrum balloti]|uniref:acyl-coenzyme A thioesterase 5-like n=1 Tax=Ylistrum balloti TaxID=509963 RepID=UPI002905A6E3|nr:acyl-coenzyme A thioesterase 5-like [Ylistrum balloti]